MMTTLKPAAATSKKNRLRQSSSESPLMSRNGSENFHLWFLKGKIWEPRKGWNFDSLPSRNYTIWYTLRIKSVYDTISYCMNVDCLNHSKLHCVSKNDTDVAHHNFNVHQQMLVIFGTDVADRVSY